MIVSIAAEGLIDLAAAKRLCKHAGHEAGREFPTRGKGGLDRSLAGYNNAARFSPWFVLRDLDHDAVCAPELLRTLLPRVASQMVFRLTVRSIEGWLLADDTSISAYFECDPAVIPQDVERLDDPKQTMLNVAAKSHRSEIRKKMLPVREARKGVGPGYAALLIDYIQTSWDIDRAATRADSLRRCIDSLRRLSG